MKEALHKHNTEPAGVNTGGGLARGGEDRGFVDRRALAATQLAGAAGNSAQSAAHQAFSDRLHQSPRMAAQRVRADLAAGHTSQPASRPNTTGMPDDLKNGIESLSGMAMDGVKVHYNSPQPAQLNALAYAQGTDIHLGPGQERHLPHEAWHVVQQAQRRVKPTMQMRVGIEVNDDAGLEHEADVMGARALRVPAGTAARAAVHAAPAASSADDAPLQGVFVKQIESRKKGGPKTYTVSAQGVAGAVDTDTMNISELRIVRQDLAHDKKAKDVISALDVQMAMMTNSIDEPKIIELGKTLDLLVAEKLAGGLAPKSAQRLVQVSFSVLHALEFLGEFDEADGDAVRFRVLLQKYLDQITELNPGALKEAATRAEGAVNLDVTAEDVAAYRADIAEAGNWGGGAEAEVIANAFGFQCRILILDSEHKYVVVDTLGNANPRARSLLNIGNHYVVVRDAAVAGATYQAAHVVYKAPEDGDCLFWALHNIAANGNATVANIHAAMPQQLDGPAFITRARELVSAQLTQGQIEQTIIEARFSGGGIGPRLASRMNLHGLDKTGLRERLSATGKSDPDLYKAVAAKLTGGDAEYILEKNKTLEALLTGYEGARAHLLKEADISKAKVAEQRGKKLYLANLLLDALRLVAAENSASAASELVPSEGQDPQLEASLRKRSAEQQRQIAASVKASPHNSAQLIITYYGTDQEFVMDRIGQLVPRKVHRGISEFNAQELDGEQFMYPTAQSPIPKDKRYTASQKEFSKQSTTSGSGTGDNKLKASHEMEHVEGVKPSPFMSTTAIKGGTINPQGVSFGNSTRIIDLAHLPPSAISATYTDRGMGYYLLSAFKGSTDEKSALIAHARDYEKRQSTSVASRKIKPSTVLVTATDAANANATLSGKEWQALMDVIRTEEILIGARIPLEAISQS